MPFGLREVDVDPRGAQRRRKSPQLAGQCPWAAREATRDDGPTDLLEKLCGGTGPPLALTRHQLSDSASEQVSVQNGIGDVVRCGGVGGQRLPTRDIVDGTQQPREVSHPR